MTADPPAGGAQPGPLAGSAQAAPPAGVALSRGTGWRGLAEPPDLRLAGLAVAAWLTALAGLHLAAAAGAAGGRPGGPR